MILFEDFTANLLNYNNDKDISDFLEQIYYNQNIYNNQKIKAVNTIEISLQWKAKEMKLMNSSKTWIGKLI